MWEEIKNKLEAFGQMHLLKFVHELSEAEKKSFFSQLSDLDFSILDYDSNECRRGNIEPIPAMSISESKKNKDRFKKIGLEVIRNGKVGAVLLAGGQGSRLGFEKPKGMFNIGVSRELYIFECLINNLLKVVREADAWIPLFIMTSVQNNDDTINFLEKHNYFGYDKNCVFFFVQEQLPTVDTNGKLMLAEKGKVSAAPNGNGGWYSSLVKSDAYKYLKSSGIEWINVFAVDNVLQKIADPYFIGAVIDTGMMCGSKVVAKAAPEERVGVMCLEDGKPSIVEYFEMTDDMLQCRENDGRLSYNYGVILNYLFKVSELDKIVGINLPLHKAFKKISYIDETGNIITPEEPNAYKYETLVLDMVKPQKNCLVFEVERIHEFAPVKNKTGVDSVDTARKLLKLNNIEI